MNKINVIKKSKKEFGFHVVFCQSITILVSIVDGKCTGK